MKVSPQDVSHVANLANLELTESERTAMLRDMNSILDHIDNLNEIDTTNVLPMAQMAVLQSEQASREDILEGLRPSLPREEALANAPANDGIFFIVPKVIGR